MKDAALERVLLAAEDDMFEALEERPEAAREGFHGRTGRLPFHTQRVRNGAS
jgi:hypothetical protein